ncbi:MAG: rod shape-determining protein MreD [Balneolales bacterium]
MKSVFIRFSLIGLVAVLLQILIFRHLGFGVMEPDFVLLILIWVIATQNRTRSLLFAAYSGLLIDLFLDLWGLHMLSKTLTTFIVYPFIPKEEDSRLFLTQIMVLIFVIALVHNLLFLIFAFFAQIYHAELIFFQILFGSSLLTAIIGSIIYLFKDN